MELQVRSDPTTPGRWLVLRQTSSNLDPSFEPRVNEQGQSVVATYETLECFPTAEEAHAYALGVESCNASE